MAIKREELIGKKFGRLTVIDLVQSETEKRKDALCKCDCGNEKTISISNLKSGATTSCGCYRTEQSGKASVTHGMTGSKIHNEWRSMKARCNIPSCSNHEFYGGRGIRICDEWNNSFETFMEWALNNGYSDALSLDRIEVNGNYEPSNCRWVDKKMQARNRRVRRTSNTGIAGVAKRSDRDSYRVTIGVNGKAKNIGNFKNFDDAIKARKQAELDNWGFTIIK